MPDSHVGFIFLPYCPDMRKWEHPSSPNFTSLWLPLVAWQRLPLLAEDGPREGGYPEALERDSGCWRWRWEQGVQGWSLQLTWTWWT